MISPRHPAPITYELLVLLAAIVNMNKQQLGIGSIVCMLYGMPSVVWYTGSVYYLFVWPCRKYILPECVACGF